MVVQWLSGITLTVKWHWIRTRSVELLHIGIQVILVDVQWLSGSTLAVKWLWIGTRLVK